MTDFEVPQPIINTPFEEPNHHWHIAEGQEPKLRDGRRPAMYFYRDRSAKVDSFGRGAGTAIELVLVNRIRKQVRAWRAAGWPGASRTTQELLAWRTRDGRKFPLFFAQVEAAETIIFLVEARSDFLLFPANKSARIGWPTATRSSCAMPAKWRPAAARRPSWA